MGIPVLDGLGIDGDGAHAVHEHILIDDIPRRGAVLAGLICDPLIDRQLRKPVPSVIILLTHPNPLLTRRSLSSPHKIRNWERSEQARTSSFSTVVAVLGWKTISIGTFETAEIEVSFKEVFAPVALTAGGTPRSQ